MLLNNRGSIPKELGNLTFLEDLKFYSCPWDLLENIPPGGITLGGLKRLNITGAETSEDEYLQSPVLVWTAFKLPVLESLSIYSAYKTEGEQVLRALKDDRWSFNHSLTRFDFDLCNLKENNLGDLLLEVLPRFPNLRELNLTQNEIESLRTIEDRIIKQRQLDNNRLCKLNLRMNRPIIDEIVANPSSSYPKEKQEDFKKEKAALLTILDTFNECSTESIIYRMGK